MDMPSVSARELAQQLLALEAARTNVPSPRAAEVAAVWEKLRVALTRFAGADGFSSLLRRAVNLARTDVPSLKTVTSDASSAALESLAADAEPAAAVAITAHLIGLLITFIGEALTLRLLREVWPDASFDE